MNQSKPIPPREAYAQAFEDEANRVYPEVDNFEQGLTCPMLLAMARVLACPVKVNPPNWQHGRILYAALVRYIRAYPQSYYNFVDIGTAKGFSAMVMEKASFEANAPGRIDSIDIVDPFAKVRRNSVNECEGKVFTVPEFVNPFRKPTGPFLMSLHGGGSQEYFAKLAPPRIHAAFVDGKHTFEAVMFEADQIAKRQTYGDLMILDDAQIAPVGAATHSIRTHTFQMIRAGFKLIAVGVRV